MILSSGQASPVPTPRVSRPVALPSGTMDISIWGYFEGLLVARNKEGLGYGPTSPTMYLNLVICLAQSSCLNKKLHA